MIGEGTNIEQVQSHVIMMAKRKHSTFIGDNVFVGSNTNFIAPVTIETVPS